jgi:hypothetical protein
MADVDAAGLREIAEQGVALVHAEFGKGLDWSLESLTVLDEVCTQLLSDGPLQDERTPGRSSCAPSTDSGSGTSRTAAPTRFRPCR